MVPKSATRLPKSQVPLSDARVAELIGTVLQEELGAIRRAAKIVIGRTGVSDHAARSWLNGTTSPSALRLIVLAAHCRPVMMAVLRLSGHDQVAVTIDLKAIGEDGSDIGADTVAKVRGSLMRYDHFPVSVP